MSEENKEDDKKVLADATTYDSKKTSDAFDDLFNN